MLRSSPGSITSLATQGKLLLSAVLLLSPLPFGCVLSLVCDGYREQLQSYLLVPEKMHSVANPSQSR